MNGHLCKIIKVGLPVKTGILVVGKQYRKHVGFKKISIPHHETIFVPRNNINVLVVGHQKLEQFDNKKDFAFFLLLFCCCPALGV